MEHITNTGMTPLLTALSNADLPMVDLLLKNGADPDHDPQARDTSSSHSGGKISYARDGSFQPQKAGSHGGTPLIRSIHYGFSDITRRLLDAGADVNNHMSCDETALAIAADLKDEKLVLSLLEHGADPNGIGPKFGTALLAAVIRREAEIARILINHGANVNQISEPHSTALIAAAERGYKEQVMLLLANFADPNLSTVRDKKWVWPLRLAWQKGHHEIVDELMWNGAKLDPEADFEFVNDFDSVYEIEVPHKNEKEQTRGIQRDVAPFWASVWPLPLAIMPP